MPTGRTAQVRRARLASWERPGTPIGRQRHGGFERSTVGPKVACGPTGTRTGTTLTCMCRSIKTLRPPYADDVTEEDMRAAALQYVRKISGMRAPAKVNAAAFGQAVDAIAASTRELLQELQVRPVHHG